MTLLYFGTYSLREDYPRNLTIIRGLQRNGVDVIQCHADLWLDDAEKLRGVGTLCGLLSFVPRAVRAYATLIARFFKMQKYDVIIVGYTGQIDVFLAAALNLWRRKPIVLDAFLSIYDTVVCDRKIVAAHSLPARALWWLDRLSCLVADMVLLDTQAHIDYFITQFGIRPDKFRRVLVGSNLQQDSLIGSVMTRPQQPFPRQDFEVLFFGSYLPLHGVDVIVRAAKKLELDRTIRFTLIGVGPELMRVQTLSQSLDVANVTFVAEMLPLSKLAIHIARADVCLGAFGATDKARRVIPSKIYDCLALGTPVITAHTAAATELLTHEITAILCEAADPDSLAGSIASLRHNAELLGRLNRGSLALFQSRCSCEAIGSALVADLTVLIAST